MEDDDDFLYGGTASSLTKDVKSTKGVGQATAELDLDAMKAVADAPASESVAQGKEEAQYDDEGDEEDEEYEEESDDDLEIVIDTRTDDKAKAVVKGATTLEAKKVAPSNEAAPQKTSTLDIEKQADYKGTALVDLDLDTDITEKPWREEGANQADYFNYGFDEFTWAAYCTKQKELRSEYTPAKIMAQMNSQDPMAAMMMQMQQQMGGMGMQMTPEMMMQMGLQMGGMSYYPDQNYYGGNGQQYGMTGQEYGAYTGHHNAVSGNNHAGNNGMYSQHTMGGQQQQQQGYNKQAYGYQQNQYQVPQSQMTYQGNSNNTQSPMLGANTRPSQQQQNSFQRAKSPQAYNQSNTQNLNAYAVQQAQEGGRTPNSANMNLSSSTQGRPTNLRPVTPLTAQNQNIPAAQHGAYRPNMGASQPQQQQSISRPSIVPAMPKQEGATPTMNQVFPQMASRGARGRPR